MCYDNTHVVLLTNASQRLKLPMYIFTSVAYSSCEPQSFTVVQKSHFKVATTDLLNGGSSTGTKKRCYFSSASQSAMQKILTPSNVQYIHPLLKIVCSKCVTSVPLQKILNDYLVQKALIYIYTVYSSSKWY